MATADTKPIERFMTKRNRTPFAILARENYKLAPRELVSVS